MGLGDPPGAQSSPAAWPEPTATGDPPPAGPPAARPPAARPPAAPPPAAEPGQHPGVDALLARCRFPPAGTAVHAAVSGGPDSMALLVLACAAGLDVTAVHVDHCLRPGGDEEAAVVAAAAARFGARFEARVVDVGDGPDLEARARRARYGVLPAGVLTGHTADDVAETVLLNVCWGAGLDGLAPLQGGGGAGARRPLLGLRRAETAALCAAVGLEPVVDPSNVDLRFRRNQVRHRLLPLLAEIAGRDPVPVLARQAELLAGDAALLDSLAAGIDPTDAAALDAAPPALARRAVRSWLRAGSDPEAHPPSAAEVARVLDVAAGGHVACQVAGGRRVARSAGRLRLEDPAARRQGATGRAGGGAGGGDEGGGGRVEKRAVTPEP